MPADPPTTSAEAFLARVRAALGAAGSAPRAQAPPLPPPIDESLVRLCGLGDDLVARFSKGAAAVGMQVHASTQRELGACLAALVSRIGTRLPRRVAVSVADDSLTQEIRQGLHAAGCVSCDWGQAPGLDAQFDADIGITDADAGLAETGTIIVRSDHSRSRGTFLVPPVHIAILRTSRILPDMLDFWGEFSGPMPTSMVFITGPSKTADIEGILITGVHGPGAVHVVLVSE